MVSNLINVLLEQSLYYNEKHKEIATHNINAFVAYFNSGICSRMIGNIPESLNNFQKAIEYANDESDLEAYVLCLCQMSISFLFNGITDKFKEFSNEFYEKNVSLKHPEMEMEMLMLSGFLYNFIKDYQKAFYYYSKGLELSKKSKNEYYKAICLSNIGIINSSTLIDDEFSKLEADMTLFESNCDWQYYEMTQEDDKIQKNNSIVKEALEEYDDEEGNIDMSNQNNSEINNYNKNQMSNEEIDNNEEYEENHEDDRNFLDDSMKDNEEDNYDD